MANKETTIKAYLTLRDGTVVSNDYARRRIIAKLRPFGMSLEDRRAVARDLIQDPWHQGVLVSYLEARALSRWAGGPFPIEDEENSGQTGDLDDFFLAP